MGAVSGADSPLSDTARLAMYGLLDDDREPTDNDFDPSGMEPGDHAYFTEYHDPPPPHPDMWGYVCSGGFLHTEDGLVRVEAKDEQ